MIEPNLNVKQFKLEASYDKWIDLSNKYDNPTRGQRAAITRAWNQFTILAKEMEKDPIKLSKQWVQS